MGKKPGIIIPLTTNNQWGWKKTPLIEVSLYYRLTVNKNDYIGS
ncbi:hypothetical protein [Virgibacillus indicus]|nr:hypothetical protein [Virgibacillus indicus]